MTKILNRFFSLITHPSLLYFAKHPLLLLRHKLIILSLIIKKWRGLDINFKDEVKSKTKIDVVMCAIDKDYDVLVHAIDSIRKYIKHPIENIYLICPVSKRIEEIAKQKKCILLDENKVLPITIKDINYRVNGANRAGWLFQQLLKWGADKYVKSDFYLVTEADTVFCRPRVFMKNKKIIFPVSSYPCHIPYFTTIYKLLGLKIDPVINLTSHHGLYDKEILRSLKGELEKKNGKPWYQAIMDKIDPSEGSFISDYDSYGQYVLARFPKRAELEFWYNKHFGRSQLSEIKKIVEKYGCKSKAISFHSYDE